MQNFAEEMQSAAAERERERERELTKQNITRCVRKGARVEREARCRHRRGKEGDERKEEEGVGGWTKGNPSCAGMKDRKQKVMEANGRNRFLTTTTQTKHSSLDTGKLREGEYKLKRS